MDENIKQNPPPKPVSPSQGGSSSYTRSNKSSSNLFDKFSSFFSKKTTTTFVVLALVIGVGATTIAVQNSTEFRQQAATAPTPIPHPEPPTPTAILPNNIISGTVYIDIGGVYGARDSGETDYSGEARIKRDNFQYATKYGNGYYFTGVPNGTHTITLEVPSGYTATAGTSRQITSLAPSVRTFEFGIKSTGTTASTPTPTPRTTTPPVSVTPASNLRTTFTCASATSVRPSFSWTPATITGGTFDAQYLDYALNQGLSYGLVGRNVWGLNQYQEGGFAQGITYWWRINTRITGTNDWRSSSVVSFTTPNCRSDLNATLNQPPNLTVGQSTNFSGSIGNQLGGAASPSYARFCAALSNLVPNYQNCLNSATYMVGNAHYVGSLVAAGTRTSLTSAPYTPSAAGTYKAWLCADASLPSGIIDEQIETNNCQSKTFTVSSGVQTATPTSTPTPIGSSSPDKTPPTSVITSPAAGSTQGPSSFYVSVTDSDTGGSGLAKCEYAVTDYNYGFTTEKIIRACNSQILITVGPNGNCRTQGTNKCTVRADSTDNAGNLASLSSRSFSINLAGVTTVPTTPAPTTLCRTPASLNVGDRYYGDVNGDGQVNTTDSGWILEYTANRRIFNQVQIEVADVNGLPNVLSSGSNVTSVDAALVSQYAANLISTFFVCSSSATITPAPSIPNCNSGLICYTCTAPTNTCGGSGTQTCTYKTHSTGACNEVSNLTTCNGAVPNPNCNTGSTCQNNVCVAPTGNPTQPPSNPTNTPGGTQLALSIGLDAIGNTGDNANRNNSSSSNKSPRRPTRNITVELFNSSTNQPVGTAKTGTVTYANGVFTGTIDLGSGFAPGSYNIKIKSDGYLKRRILGVALTTGVNTVPPIFLVVGDINGDNQLTIVDYNILISCSTFSTDNHGACNANAQYAVLSDFEDNGAVNQFDYNLFLREYSVQAGD